MKTTCVVALCAVGACADLSGPASDLAFVDLVPVFSPDAARLYEELPQHDLAVNNLHLRLSHESGEVALDTVIDIRPGQDSVVIDVQVRLYQPQEFLEAVVQLRSADSVMFAGIQDIPAKRGGYLTSRPPAIDMVYVGPGARAATLRIGPSDTTIVARDSIAFQPVAADVVGNQISVSSMSWTVRDPTRGTVSATGVFRPSGGKGETYVIGRLPTGLRDSTLVRFTPKL